MKVDADAGTSRKKSGCPFGKFNADIISCEEISNLSGKAAGCYHFININHNRCLIIASKGHESTPYVSSTDIIHTGLPAGPLVTVQNHNVRASPGDLASDSLIAGVVIDGL